MQIPLVHPLRPTAWSNPAIWSSIRDKVCETYYPTPFTDRMDVVIEGYSARPGNPYPPAFSPPTGCSRMDLLINESPGRRTGGTPQHAWLLNPSSTYSGTKLFFQCGTTNYTSPYIWNEYYCMAGRSVILSALALGWVVVLCENSLCGYNPGSTGNPAKAQVMRDGVLTEMGYGDFYDLYGDSGSDPEPELMMTDDASKSMNEVDARYPSGRWVFCAHCGGSGYSALQQCCDSRFVRSAWSRLYAPTVCQPYPNGSNVWGAIYRQTEVATQDYWSIVTAAIAKPGHKSIITASARDPGQSVYDIGKWRYWWEMIADAISPLGADLHLYEEPTLDDHSMQAAEVTAIMDILQS